MGRRARIAITLLGSLLFACSGGDTTSAETTANATFTGGDTSESSASDTNSEGVTDSQDGESGESNDGGDGDGDSSTSGDGDGDGGLGDDCVMDEDCEGELVCVYPDPEGDGVCASLCDPSCPEGYICDTLPTSMGTADVCVPAPETFCSACETNNDCGDGTDYCITLAGGNFCTVSCFRDPSVCPEGFTCGLIAGSDNNTEMQCVPDSGQCCIDGDGDSYGVGGGCLGPDCNDEEASANEGASELCDNIDNDCDMEVDEDPIDCAGASCEIGILGYFEKPAEQCLAGGVCEEVSSDLCGLYTCADGEDNGDTCATACDGEDDYKCIPSAHCDADVCYEDFADGEQCDESSDCESDHCANGVCCDFGDCCQDAFDCPGFGTISPICENPATCQGTRGDVVCEPSFQCGTVNGVPDDSACDGQTLADDCGLYLDIYCDGGETQTPPVCPNTCSSHADCDDVAFCNPNTQQCEAKRPDGEVCEGDDDNWCINDFCENGFCCNGTTGQFCCAAGSDCPASFSTDAVCDTPSACQGSAVNATCNNSICGSVDVDDDTACDVSGGAADECGYYLPVFCDGTSAQNDPDCPTSCNGDEDCDANAYCNTSGACVPDEPDGDPCLEADHCQSDYCSNGFCCGGSGSELCCANSGDCGTLNVPASCDDESACSGTRTDGVCGGDFICSAQIVSDGSGCNGSVSSDCGPYPSAVCPDTSCDDSCVDDDDCDPSAHCDNGECVPDEGQGGFCDEPSDCGPGLSCVDNVCCTSSCTGGCMACDVPGFEGTCTNIPNGSDPDNECGAIDCAGYYHGFIGNTCYEKADVPAGIAACNGGGACQSAAGLCALQSVGLSTITCDDFCQDPTPGSCSGTDAGACTNVDQGDETCGWGPCAVTEPLCINGSPNDCEPNSSAASTESCNNIDDDCNGTVDDGAFSDNFESNNSSGSTFTLSPNAGTAEAGWHDVEPTVFGQGDVDYFKVQGRENDSTCQCCDTWCTDEDIRVQVRLTVPSGAGSYIFCTAESLSGVENQANCVEVGAGSTWQRDHANDGCCAPTGCSDSIDVYVKIYGDNSPGFECAPYLLEYDADRGCY